MKNYNEETDKKYFLEVDVQYTEETGRKFTEKFIYHFYRKK